MNYSLGEGGESYVKIYNRRDCENLWSTVRTVQYYDSRGILTPSELSEGGRRLYSENDLKRMKIICFLRELDIPINAISKLLLEENADKTISLILEHQELSLKNEINGYQNKLIKIEEMKSAIKNTNNFSVDSIGDIAYTMKNKNELKKIRYTLLFTGIPLSILQISGIILWITKGIWWLFMLWVIVAIPYTVIITKNYYRKVAYICPECHTVFKPSFKEVLLASHTPTTRKLTCTSCGCHGFCVEVISEVLAHE